MTPPQPEKYVLKTEVRPLTGSLDDTLMFNSNSPEIVRTNGILLSLLPGEGKRCPEAHLNFPLKGKYRIFMHHINNKVNAPEPATLYVALLAYNPNKKDATVRISKASSYLSRPDSPFVPLEPVLDNDEGTVFAGPGDRVTLDFVRNDTQMSWPRKVTVPKGGYALIANLPVPVVSFLHPLNGRSTLMEVSSTVPIHYASLGLSEVANDDPPPSLERWIKLAEEGELAKERDKTPTPPEEKNRIIFGRVAGVQKGAFWTTAVTDEGKKRLSVPEAGRRFAYPVSTVIGGTFATDQVESAPMLVRYPDTAYQAHGNYGVQYDLTFPLVNSTTSMMDVRVSFDSPVKTNRADENLTYHEPASIRMFYRGTVRFAYTDDSGKKVVKYWHLAESQGYRAPPLVSMRMKPGGTRKVNVRLLYPPDATPPQVVTIESCACAP